MRRSLALATSGLLFTTALVQASDQPPSPAGMWRTIDDKTGQPRGIVRVCEERGRYDARIERSLTPSEFVSSRSVQPEEAASL